MRFYDEAIVKNARKMRNAGTSFSEIAKKLGLNDRTVRRWCHDIDSRNKAFRQELNDRELIKSIAFENVSKVKIDVNLAKVIASILYWAEGTKYPNSVAVSFSNSDPAMVEFFIRLLRKAFKIDESKFRVHLQIHTTHDQNEIFSYWSKLLNIPREKFWKPTITNPSSKMKRQGYVGTCTLRYRDYKILLQLTGIFENLPLRKGG